jgi:phenylpyruvate tautomerase PptA (4-oxalocrotonate tautomerase family)
MPLIKLETSAAVAADDKAKIALALSKIAAGAIGKPETYVMAVVSEATMTMAGEAGPAAFLDVRSIGGLSQSVNRDLTGQVCALLGEKLGIPGDRVYVSFASSAAVDWGWNNSTFG